MSVPKTEEFFESVARDKLHAPASRNRYDVQEKIAHGDICLLFFYSISRIAQNQARIFKELSFFLSNSHVF